MTPPKVVRLASVPRYIANLAFPASGILDAIADVGTNVAALSLEDVVYPHLGDVVADNPASLQYTSGFINAFGRKNALAYLRAPQLAARLDSAIANRENAYYQKYAHQSAIIDTFRGIYFGQELTPGKLVRLQHLQLLANIQRDALDAHYAQNGLGQATPPNTPFWWLSEGSGGHQIIDQAANGGTIGSTTTSLNQNGSTLGTTNGTQTIGTTVPLWPNRIPMLENYAVNHRAQISLGDQLGECGIQTLMVDSLDQIFTNELKMIDLDVRQLQIAYLDTFLFSPINGVVTAVAQTPGGAASAGQTVVRVENNDVIYIAGRVSSRSLIGLGQQATITTQALFGDPSQTATLTGTVRAVESRGAEDHFDIVVDCSNISPAGGHLVPSRYSFPYDTTTITFA